MTALLDNLDSISTREELSEFIAQLSKDLKNNKEEWENPDLPSFLEAMSAWVDAIDGYYKNKGEDMPQDVPWDMFANILYAAKIYE